MPANDVTEAKNALRLAYERWGPTGFHCAECGHDRAWHLAPGYPRTFQCKKCRRMKSVTAGTMMHGTKLPLKVWNARGEWHDLARLPTSRGFAAEHGIAPSSAWHLNQRFMAGVDLGKPAADPLAGRTTIERLPCRRPRPTPPLAAEARAPLRDKHRQFLETPRGRKLLAEIVLGVGGYDVVVIDAPPSREVLRSASEDGLGPVVRLHHAGVERFVRDFLQRRLATVCVRWLAVYVRCAVEAWSRQRNRTEPVRWATALLAQPHRKLSALRDAASAPT
jgi:hypothetical protein